MVCLGEGFRQHVEDIHPQYDTISDVTIANSESFKCFTSPIETPACVCDFPRFQHPA